MRKDLLALNVIACFLLSPITVSFAETKGETEKLVPPGGSVIEVPVHANQVCILSFPEELKKSALTSSTDFEIKAWDKDGVAVRANGRTPTATVALATVSGAIKVNITFRVVPDKAEALTLVRFKAASYEETLEARVAAEVSQRIAPIQAELAQVKKLAEAQLGERADALLAERMLKRTVIFGLNSHERNNANVIINVSRASMVGDDGYLFFDVENRSRAPFRIARVAVYAEKKLISGPTRLTSGTLDKDPAVVGVVPPGSQARGIVTVRNATQVLKKSLELEVATPDGQDSIRLTGGIEFR